MGSLCPGQPGGQSSILEQPRGAAEPAGRIQPLLCGISVHEEEMPAHTEHSPRLSSPIAFVGEVYLFNLLHCLVNHCSSARRIGVSRAGLPAGSAPSIVMTQHLAAPWAFQRRFIKKHTVHASTINPGRSCRACRASHTSLRAGAGPTTPGLNCRGRFELLGVPFS